MRFLAPFLWTNRPFFFLFIGHLSTKTVFDIFPLQIPPIKHIQAVLIDNHSFEVPVESHEFLRSPQFVSAITIRIERFLLLPSREHNDYQKEEESGQY